LLRVEHQVVVVTVAVEVGEAQLLDRSSGASCDDSVVEPADALRAVRIAEQV
jgi:hypothetical protein